ncbi:MAG: hypothetical protein JWN91_3969 [Nocardioides sp.]|jgi:hypothetical protein|nr:hypothetical protein [Nocardioides sp.]
MRMTSRRRMAALLTAVLGAAVSVASLPSAADAASRTASECTLSPKLVPTCHGILSGAFVAPHPGESNGRAVSRFEQESQHRAQILHFYYRADRLFPNADETQALERGAGNRILFANWKPDDGYTWRQVANGAADARLVREAKYLQKTWDHRLFLAVHHEPENEVRDWPGSGYTAADYAAMYRHVVDVFRAQGASKVVWVMNYMGAQKWALTDWYSQLWPGQRYVDWIAFDPYKTAGLGGQDGGFPTLVNQYWGNTSWRGAYNWAHREHPDKPVMLGEWGVGERRDNPAWKATFFRGIAAQLDAFPQLRALVYFDNDNADVAGNVSIDTSPQSLQGFRDYLGSGSLASIG